MALWRPEILQRLDELWAPETCHVAVMVGRPISVGGLDSSFRTEEPVCSCGCLPAEVKGPAAAAEVTAAAVAAMRQQQVAVKIETAGREAAGLETAGRRWVSHTGSSC